MRHTMKLKEDPFERMKNGTKTIEFRLYDEKRRKIKVGDEIEFFKLPKLQERILVRVKNLYRGDSFKNLFKIIFPDKDNKEINNKTEEMLKYYTHEQEKEYGVIGIEIEIIVSNFRYTYNKLVRENDNIFYQIRKKLKEDKIPENIDNMKGRKSKYKILDDAEYLKELNRKVIEEANEFIEENSIEELGDLMEVLNAIMKLKGYKLEEVNKIMKEKNEKKGAFDNKIFLEYIDEEKRNLDEEEELQKKFRR